MPQTIVYKIISSAQWEEARRSGSFLGSADDLRDGFIHLSAAPQVGGTLARHFAGQADLMLVAFDAAQLAPALRWEASRGGDLFPHLYGPLPASDAIRVIALPQSADGATVLPEELA